MGSIMKGHCMQALCKYCRAMTTSVSAPSGNSRLCQNCLRPYEPCGTSPPGVSPQDSTTLSLPMWASGPQVSVEGDHNTPRATQAGADPICPYLRERNNEQTVHLAPHKHNACYAQLRQQDHWWRLSPWVASMPTPVTRQYQAHYCFATYMSCAAFRPLGTPEIQTQDSALALQLTQ